MIRFPEAPDPEAVAEALIARSILSYGIYELWGSGSSYPALHENVRSRSSALWNQHNLSSFRFELDSYQGSRSKSQQRDIIESFSYTGFSGPIKMNNPENQFVVFEEYDLNASLPKRLYFGRLLASSGRRAIAKYSLKKRNYIATTSMDAELSLVTANLALAGPGKIAYDPFVGTGSFPLACAHFGACVLGSDLDGRSIRGKAKRNVKGNFEQYGTSASYLGGFVADLTHAPLRDDHRWLDAILCDPPYGVREGLKVLGSAKPALQDEVLLENGQPAHLSDHYLPPKQPYSFTRMLDDILDFSARKLVDEGRLCMWMPVADATSLADTAAAEQDGQEGAVYDIPQHPQLELVSECVQQFNKCKDLYDTHSSDTLLIYTGSRRLLTYRRKLESEVDPEHLLAYNAARLSITNGDATLSKKTADDLNDFRRKVCTQHSTQIRATLKLLTISQYFQGFKPTSIPQ